MSDVLLTLGSSNGWDFFGNDPTKGGYPNLVTNIFTEDDEIYIGTRLGFLVISESPECCESKFITMDAYDGNWLIGSLIEKIEVVKIGEQEDDKYDSNVDYLSAIKIYAIKGGKCERKTVVMWAHNCQNGCYSSFDPEYKLYFYESFPYHVRDGFREVVDNLR